MEKITRLSEESFVKSIIRTHKFPDHDKVYVDGSGDFTMAHKNMWNKTTGYDENQRFVKIHKDSRFLFSAAHHKAEFINLGDVYHLDHGTSLANTGPSLEKYRLANGPYKYGRLLLQTAGIIKEIDAGSKIIGGSMDRVFKKRG